MYLTEPDSAGYLTMATFRPPVYPLLVSAFRWIFGQLALDALVVFQVLLLATCSFMLARYLAGKLLAGDKISLTLLVCILFAGGVGMSPYILSEALAYPLFLLTCLFALVFWFEKRQAGVLILLAVLNTFVKPQMACALAGAFILLALRKRFAAILLLLIGFWTGSYAEGLYHRHFVGAATKTSGYHTLASTLLMLYQPGDEAKFDGSDYRQVMREIFQEMERRQNAIFFRNPWKDTRAAAFSRNLDDLAFATVEPIFQKHYPRATIEEKNRFYKVVYETLAPGKRLAYLRLIFSKILYWYGPTLILFQVVLLFMGLLVRTDVAQTISILTLFDLGNKMILVLLAANSLRYHLYSHALGMSVAVLLLFSWYRQHRPQRGQETSTGSPANPT